MRKILARLPQDRCQDPHKAPPQLATCKIVARSATWTSKVTARLGKTRARSPQDFLSCQDAHKTLPRSCQDISFLLLKPSEKTKVLCQGSLNERRFVVCWLFPLFGTTGHFGRWLAGYYCEDLHSIVHLIRKIFNQKKNKWGNENTLRGVVERAKVRGLLVVSTV